MQQPHSIAKRWTLDEVMEAFEQLSPEERARDIARTEARLRATGVRTLADLDKLDENDVTA